MYGNFLRLLMSFYDGFGKKVLLLDKGLVGFSLTGFIKMMWNDVGHVSTYLTSQIIGILQSLVNLTVLQVILWSLSFHLLVKLLLVFQLTGEIHVRVSASGKNQWKIYRLHPTGNT